MPERRPSDNWDYKNHPNIRSRGPVIPEKAKEDFKIAGAAVVITVCTSIASPIAALIPGGAALYKLGAGLDEVLKRNRLM